MSSYWLGKSRLKFEIKSYLETVVKQLKQMKEDNEQLIWFKNKVAKEQRHSKAVEESYSFLSEKFRKMSEETHVVRIRTKKHHEQNKEEVMKYSLHSQCLDVLRLFNYLKDLVIICFVPSSSL